MYNMYMYNYVCACMYLYMHLLFAVDFLMSCAAVCSLQTPLCRPIVNSKFQPAVLGLLPISNNVIAAMGFVTQSAAWLLLFVLMVSRFFTFVISKKISSLETAQLLCSEDGKTHKICGCPHNCPKKKSVVKIPSDRNHNPPTSIISVTNHHQPVVHQTVTNHHQPHR